MTSFDSIKIYREEKIYSGARSFTTDFSPANGIGEIVGEINGASRVFVQGQDYELQTNGTGIWLSTGVTPDLASAYYVSYSYSPSLLVIIDHIFSRIKSVRPDVNALPGSPMYTLIASFAQTIEDVYHVLIYTQNIAFLDTARGGFLDEVAGLLGAIRKPAVKAGGTVTFYRSEPSEREVQIPVGTQVATTPSGGLPSMYYSTDNTVNMLAGNVSVNADITCTVPGTVGNAGAETVNMLVSTIGGIDSVSNTYSVSGGDDIEDDYLFRERARGQLALLGKGTRDGVKRLCESVDGIREAVVKDRNDDVEIPAGQANIMLIGDTPDFTENSAPFLAVKALLLTGSNKAAGPYYVFSAPTIIFCNIDITVDTGIVAGGNPTKLFAAAVKNLMAYVNGGYSSADKFYYPLSLGDSLYRNQIIAKILDVDGITDLDDESMVLVKTIVNEEHTYDGDDADVMDVTSDEPHAPTAQPDIISVVGDDVGGGGTKYTFTKDTDYIYDEVIIDDVCSVYVNWQGTSHHPDNNATYRVTYSVNENHDIDTTMTQLLKAGTITLNESS